MCSPSAPSTTSNVTIPEYAKPFMEDTLARTQALTTAEYTPFEGDRLAGLSEQQKAVSQGILNRQMPGQFAAGTNLAQAGGERALAASQYDPSQFYASNVQAPQLQQFQMRGPQRVQGGLGSFVSGQTANQFMSPYMQNVVDLQKQEAIRDAQKQQLGTNLAAARQGTYGGARQALMQTERERNLGTQLAQIQASGSQAAYDQAQKAFEAEQARRLQAGMQTQQLGSQAAQQNLAARLGVQQLGAQQGLQAQQLNQQAMLEAQKMAEQSRQYGAGLGLQGAQAATQAGATLGQLGIGEQQQYENLAKLQAAAAGEDQAMRQKQLDIDYENYITKQQYPYKQLGFMSDILRGSSNLAGTGGKTVYESNPSMLSQLVGPGLLGLGLYREFGR